jgi:hypothetical protein
MNLSRSIMWNGMAQGTEGGGSYVLGRQQNSRMPQAPGDCVYCSKLSTKGHVFAMQCDPMSLEAGNAGHWINMDDILLAMFNVIKATLKLYGSTQVEKPGELLLSHGCLNVRGVHAHSVNARGGGTRFHYLENGYRHDELTNYASLAADPVVVMRKFYDHFKHAFNVASPSSDDPTFRQFFAS